MSGCKTDERLLAGFVNNQLRELGSRLFSSARIRKVNIDSFSGYRVYTRTLWLILQHAIERLYPSGKLYIRHSIGERGYYCEIEGREELSIDEIKRVESEMRRMVEADLPITRQKLPTTEVREIYRSRGYDDKIALLDTRPRLYSEIYTLSGTVGYFYGSLAPSTRYVPHFELNPYHNGLFIALPIRGGEGTISSIPNQNKMFDIFHGYQSWVDMLGFPTVGELNAKVLAGESNEMIKIAEALHEKSIAALADSISAAHLERGVTLVMISGPSSSGKTTLSHRLGIQLKVLGFQPQLISLDDYFVDRELTPLDESGEYDFEALEAIDVDLFNEHLQRLLSGDRVAIPRYDFVSGKSLLHAKPLELGERSLLIIEGIHGLNPKLTPLIDEQLKFSIYVSCFTAVAMDDTSRIATSDNRLLRRLTRDNAQRGTNAAATLARWNSVRRGEERHIFPYQENAYVMFNSSLFYEISVLKRYVEPILHSVPNTLAEYELAHSLLGFLDNFIPIDPSEIPSTSLLREFIGKSSFNS